MRALSLSIVLMHVNTYSFFKSSPDRHTHTAPSSHHSSITHRCPITSSVRSCSVVAMHFSVPCVSSPQSVRVCSVRCVRLWFDDRRCSPHRAKRSAVPSPSSAAVVLLTAEFGASFASMHFDELRVVRWYSAVSLACCVVLYSINSLCRCPALAPAFRFHCLDLSAAVLRILSR